MVHNHHFSVLIATVILASLCPTLIKGQEPIPDYLHCIDTAEPSTLGPVCYLLVSTALDFDSAEAYCNDHNGHLARADDNATNVQIAALSLMHYENCVSNIWIGGRQTNISQSMSFTWTKLNSLVTYTNFGDLSMHDITNDCIYQTFGDGKWYVSACSEGRPFVCEVPMYASKCDSTYTYYEVTDMCYKARTNRSLIQFDDAESVCISEGGHLASIHSKDENYFLSDLSSTGFLTNERQMTWIGFKSDAEGVYTWTDGTQTNYTNFFDGGADTNNKCASFFPDGAADGGVWIAGWKSQNCSSYYGRFICKKKPIQVPYWFN